MSTHQESYEERRERRREEERRYELDVFYEVWRSGGNPDRIDDDRVRSQYENGVDAEGAAQRELRAQRPKPPEEEYLEQ